MSWDLADFIVFGAMVAGVGVPFAVVMRKSGSSAYRIAAGVALAATFLLLWVNGAVGIIGNESNDANMMFPGVIVIGVIGAFIARFQASGMSRALYATAIAQAIVAVVALVGGLGSTAPAWPQDVLLLSGFFTVLWIISGRLFRKAAAGNEAGSPA